MRDLAYALRQLKKSLGFTLVAVASLALGIGANTAIFELVEAIRLRMLPVERPGELAFVDFEKNSTRSGWFSTRNARLTYAQYDEIRKKQEAFNGLAVWSATRFNLAQGGEVRYAEGLYANGDFFRSLGVNPAVGRTFTAQEDTDACSNPGAVLSHSFWQREFGGDQGVLGKTVSLDGHTFPVIGVTPASFFGVEVGRRFEVAIPLCADKMISEDQKGRIPVKHAWWLAMIGRLKPGWTLEKANVHLHTLSPGLMEATVPPQYKPQTAKKYLANKIGATEGGTGVSGLRREYEQPLWLLLATTALVLLIACANLANLLLARASAKEREVAVRLALGASRGRLLRQMLAESLLLAAAGSALGVLLAQMLSQSLIAFISTSESPLFVGLSVDWRVLGFATALGVVTCLLFGLVPALRATGAAPASAIRSGGRSVTEGPGRFSLRRALVVTQVAFSLVLLAGALLFVRSLRNLMTTDMGFKAEGVMTVSIDYSRGQIPQERRVALNRDLLERLSAQPGVVSASQTWWTPVSGAGWNNEIGPDGSTAAASGKLSNFNRVGPRYFYTMGTQLVAGREFTRQDTLSSAKVAIVNEEFGRKFFGRPDIVGRTFRVEAAAGKPEDLFQIVGVVRNTKYYEVREEFKPIGYFPVEQEEEPGPQATFVLRVQGSPSETMRGVRRSVSKAGPAMSLQFRSFSGQLEESLLRERLMAMMSGAFALLAGLLATLGLYGVIAYMVARRRNEIGVRIALGADRWRVIRLVLRETALLLGAGLAIGLVFALWAARGATTLLYSLKPWDPWAMAGAVGLLVLVGLAAGFVPARRAAAVEPMVALRNE